MVFSPDPEILTARYRAARSFDLVPRAALRSDELDALGPLRSVPGVFGLLRSRTPGLRSLVVDHDTADMYRALSAAATLPERVAGRPRTIARLVLDGVFEVEAGSRFVGGAEAHPLFFGDEDPWIAAGRTARLSIQALQHADRLRLDDTSECARRLYGFHRLPASPSWRRTLPDPGAVARHLGIAAVRARVGEADGTSDGFVHHPVWLTWRKRPVDAGVVTYKVYVSPNIQAIRPAFRVVADLFERRDDVVAFKVGRDLYGLLRPDKLIVYVRDREAVDHVADLLRVELHGLPPHGVPFTAAIEETGLLSWGVDPPRVATAPGVPRDESWRSWLVMQLAIAVRTAHASACPVPAWRFALDRAGLEGVDTATWAPDDAGPA